MMQQPLSADRSAGMVVPVPSVSPQVRRLAWSLAAAAMLAAVGALGLGIRLAVVHGDADGLLSHVALTPFITVGYALVGAWVTARQPRNPMGWLFLTVGLLSGLQAISGLVQEYGLLANREGNNIPATITVITDLAGWLGIWLWMPVTFGPTMFVFLLFPDGRLLSSRWKVVLWSAGLGIGLSVLVMALHPGPLESWGTGGGNPFGVSSLAGVLEILSWVAQLFVAIGFFGAVTAFVLRFRRSSGTERQQMKWLLYAMTLVVVAVVISSTLFFARAEAARAVALAFSLFSLSVLGIAVAASIAILRYRLYDIDLVVNRTLVYAALTLCIVVTYALIVGSLGALFQAQGSPILGLLATGTVAVLFQPLRGRLQGGVNRLFYGERDDPLGALSRLGQRLEATLDPETVLSTLVETIAQTLKLPYVAIGLRASEASPAEKPAIAAQNGVEPPDFITLPLVYQGRILGQLMVGSRGPGEPFSAADRRLLENIAHQAGPAVQAVQLTAALQHSRLQLVTAREEERRRLRRDLHDGLGATLAALHLEAGALRRSIRDDPEKAERLVAELREDIKATIDDIRHLVYELRPPTLDQLGLVAAVRAQAAQCSRPEGPGTQSAQEMMDEQTVPALHVNVEAPEAFPPLPAAVEVAAYRITQEALTNVVHHARARHCLVRLEMSNQLRVEIVDDGIGLAPTRLGNGGLGLLSMRERAEELGGTCVIEPLSEGGTRVSATIPLPEVGE